MENIFILRRLLSLIITTSVFSTYALSQVIDYDGNTYQTVEIGNQIWMAENLRSTHYSDGSPIPYLNYDNDTANGLIYGRLYTWAAVMNGAESSNTNPSNVQGIAPDGWHLPSKAEWHQLADFLGGTLIAGGKLKETGNNHWLSPNTGATNESGFTALPAGMYAFWQEFQWKGEYCAFSSTTDQSVPNHPEIAGIKLSYDNVEIIIGGFHPDDALSVRCVKDNGNTEVINELSNPDGYTLFQNYPNPFNPTTKISYQIPEPRFVLLKVFDVLGNEIATIVNEEKAPGEYEVEFNASKYSSGIYFYKLQTGNYSMIKKMVILK